MWKKIKLIELVKTSLVVTTICIAMSIPAQAGAAKGKPFLKINGEIIALEETLNDRIDGILERVEGLEASRDAHVGLIADLQGEVDQLQGLLGLDDDGKLARLDELEAVVAELEAQITIIVNDTTLADAIKANQDLIDSLIKDISGDQGLESKINEINLAIAGLEERLAELEDDIVLKQHRVNGTCASGSSIRRIYEDGTVSCEYDSIGNTGNLTTRTVTYNLTVSADGTAWQATYCAMGDVVVGGGFSGLASTTSVKANHPHVDIVKYPGRLGWRVDVKRTALFSGDEFTTYVVCASLE